MGHVCRPCLGTGMIEDVDDIEKPCPACTGRGWVLDDG